MTAGGRLRLAQRLAAMPPYSYRRDPAVPAFPDDKALLVFDGVCVLCSGLARFVLERDTGFAFRFATAQSPLGQALMRHYGLDPHFFETNLVLADGRAHARLDSVALVGVRLGGAWRALAVLRLLPTPLGDWIYDRVAQSRYALFGRSEHCMLPPPRWRERFLG
ncbi:MAG TPA: DCC1-like thiol-disulfide oxidoreductase family protein [Hyphomicrobiaceae bacterium]|nr:DCC1-like thiol-disulfide oxidoreductase family protein [Hyphomicrobiaceae bacterium]